MTAAALTTRSVFITLLFVLLASPLKAQSLYEKPQSSSRAYREIKRLGVLGKVLYIAAHPDDENTRFIAYTTRKRLFHTAYFSFTRGTGGQNLIGEQQAPLLGVIRTEELLQARRVDGGEQFFSRALDFGYSKTAEETLSMWNRDAALADLVRVIREFRPDILVTRFQADTPGHGHHKASAILAREAFEKAGNASAFPEQVKAGLEPWAPVRLIHNMPTWLGENYESREDLLALEIGSYLPNLGESLGEIAARSRSMHKSQGFGTPPQTGSAIEYFKHVAGSEAEKDIFSGIDTSWRRVVSEEQAHAIAAKIREILNAFNPASPKDAIPGLLVLRTLLKRLPTGHWRTVKLAELDHAILTCTGLHIRSQMQAKILHAGDIGEFSISLNNRGGAPLTLRKVSALGSASRHSIELPTNEVRELSFKRRITKNTGISTPYWIRKKIGSGMYEVEDEKLLGKAKAPSPFTVTLTLSLGKHVIETSVPTYFYERDPIQAEKIAEIAVLPPVTIEFAKALFVVKEKPAQYSLTLHSSGKAIEGSLHIHSTSDFRVSPAKQNVVMRRGETFKNVTFAISADSKKPKRGELSAYFEHAGEKYADTKVQLAFPHFPEQNFVYHKPAYALSIPALPETSIAYIPGSKDLLPDILRELGFNVSILNKENVFDVELASFDAVVLGIRALNTSPWLADTRAKLLDYVKAGGSLIIQYNTVNKFSTIYSEPWPYTLKLSRARVTDENAAVSILDRKHPVFNRPFAIDDSDFSDWVQERGLYFAESWSSEYTPLLAMHDPNEDSQKGSLLVARYGEGRVLYTGLSFFRQLPQGVPGATKLFVNLLLHHKTENSAQ